MLQILIRLVIARVCFSNKFICTVKGGTFVFVTYTSIQLEMIIIVCSTPSIWSAVLDIWSESFQHRNNSMFLHPALLTTLYQSSFWSFPVSRHPCLQKVIPGPCFPDLPLAHPSLNFFTHVSLILSHFWSFSSLVNIIIFVPKVFCLIKYKTKEFAKSHTD